MNRRASSSVTLPEVVVFTVVLGACGWLFTTVVSTYGDHPQIDDLRQRVASLEHDARICPHGG